MKTIQRFPLEIRSEYWEPKPLI